MGFLSKLMKNPIVQMLTPMALSMAMPHLGITGLMSGIKNPMLRSALEQSLLGFGTAKLTGSKHPEKAAMYSGLASMPFSFMKAANAANLYNEELAALQDSPELFKTDRVPVGTGKFTKPRNVFSLGQGYQIPGKEIMKDSFTFGPGYEAFKAQEKLTPWDVLSGSDKVAKKMVPVPEIRDMRRILEEGPRQTAWDLNKDKINYSIDAPEVDFYSKVGTGGKNLLGGKLEEGKEYTDWLPTIASQAAGWYGGRPTDEELWEDSKSRRRKELAFMYGIPEDMVGGEMQNPYYGGGGFWRDGGIATLEMDAGGAINGPGGPKDDVIDAKLSDGEFVMTAKAVENFGGGDRMAGAKRMYQMMNQLDPESETVQESVIGVS
tara:strand:+ start:545 stop:1675 length:1131 start_codon:yes stop_codon:yes gene_type:complete